MTKYIRIIKNQNTFDLSIAVKVTIILFLCGLLNCIRADLFMNNALYKCCKIPQFSQIFPKFSPHHSLRCVAQRSDKKMVHWFIFHFLDLVGGVLGGGGRWVSGRWCVREVGGGGKHETEQNWRFQ